MFKNELKRALQGSGNTYIQLADSLKINSHTVSDWLLGRVVPPKADRMNILRHARATVNIKKSPMAQKICDYRKINNLSQKELAEKLGTAVTTITQWENDTTKPFKKYMRKLNKLFGVKEEECSIGQMIMNVRYDQELSQKNFAKAINVSHSTVDKWEHGKLEPKQSYIDKINEVFGVSL